MLTMQEQQRAFIAQTVRDAITEGIDPRMHVRSALGVNRLSSKIAKQIAEVEREVKAEVAHSGDAPCDQCDGAGTLYSRWGPVARVTCDMCQGRGRIGGA